MNFQLIFLLKINNLNLQRQKNGETKKKYVQVNRIEKDNDSKILKQQKSSRSKLSVINNMSMDLDEYVEIDEEEFPFNFKFNEYLRLIITKILPPKNQKIKILPSNKKLKGPPSECKKLLNTIQIEFNENTIKVIKYNKDLDIDEIDYKISNISIYRPTFLEKAIQNLEKLYEFKTEARNLKQKIKEESIFLVRMSKSIEKQTLSMIQKIISSNSQKLNQTIKNEYVQRKNSDDSIKEEQEGPSFYQIQQNRKKSKIPENNHDQMDSKFYEQPDVDDSISVASVTKKKRKYVQIKTDQRIVVARYEYPAQKSINIDNFRQWLKRNKNLSPDDVQIQQIRDKFSDDIIIKFKISLVLFKSDEIQKKKEIIEIYLKFQRVVLVTFKNLKYKQEMIAKFEQDDLDLTVKYIEGYKNPKWNEKSLWNYLKKDQVQKQKKGAINQKFSAFWLIGVQNLVQNMQRAILEAIDKQLLQDIEQDLQLNISYLSKYQSNLKVKSFINETVKQYISANYSDVCSVKNIECIQGSLRIRLNIKFQRQQQFEKYTKNLIIKKTAENIVEQEYKSDFKLDPALYARLEKEYIIVQKDQRGFKFVTSLKNLSNVINHIHKEIQILSKMAEKELALVGRIVFNKAQEFIKKMLANQKDLKEIKFNCSKNQQKQQYTLKFYGIGYLIEELIAKLNENLDQIKSKIISYRYEIKKKQAQILNCSKAFQEKIYKQHHIALHINLNAKICCQLQIESTEKQIRKKTINIVKSDNLDMVPYGSLIYFRSQQQINKFSSYYLIPFKQSLKGPMLGIYQSKEVTRNYNLFLAQKKNTDQIIKSAVEENKKNNIIVLIMPKQQKYKFVREIITCLTSNKQFFNRQIKIMIVQTHNTHNQDIEKVLDFPSFDKIKFNQKTFSKYYAIENNNKYYYLDSGNKKIDEAIQKGLSKVYLYNDDLKISHKSHTYNTKTSILLHIQSGKTFQTTLQFGKITFKLKQMQFQFPSNLYQEVMNSKANNNQIQLSLGVYEIDLKQMKQINLFSGFERPIKKDEQKLNPMNQLVKAYYDVNIAQIIYSFSDEGMKNIPTVYREIANFLSNKLIVKEFDISQYKIMNREIFMASWKSTDSQQNIECQHLVNQKKIKIKAYDENDINKAKLILDYEKKRQSSKIEELTYPKTWVQQKQDIEIFIVNEQTEEFRQVQKLFTVGKIKQLIRIQNKIIYKKYFEEGQFLKELNNNKDIRTLQLFHGTRQTDPKDIYFDKEESFNINYSSDSNLLGKGIYFAEKSQYSNSYRYVQQKNLIFSSVHSMFLCSVYVGDSMKCPKHSGDIKDTDYKDPIKRIRYQSMTDYLSNSNIYVVYKSRRAYPLYLIKY